MPHKEGFLVEKCKNPNCGGSGYRMRENAEYCSPECKTKHEKAVAKAAAKEKKKAPPELELEIVEKPQLKQLNLFGDED